MIIKSNKLYDVMKWIVTVVLPAAEALWLTLGDVWGFPYLTQIGATIAAVTVFLGAILGVSNHSYKGKVLAAEQDGNADYTTIVESEEVEDNGITIEDE